jgi:hypothetical protein
MGSTVQLSPLATHIRESEKQFTVILPGRMNLSGATIPMVTFV